MSDTQGGKPVAELIGNRRVVFRRLDARSIFNITRDVNRTDYAFWDRLRNGRAADYLYSGLFVRPVASKITAWAFGRPPSWTHGNNDKYTIAALSKWFSNNYTEVMRAVEDSITLGDCFLVVNSNLTLSVVPPTAVDPIVDEDDYSKIIGWRIIERYPHPVDVSRTMTIEDEFYPDRRIRKIYRDGSTAEIKEYRNLIGIVPVVHIANSAGSDELFGRPELEALLPILVKYNEVLQAAIEGNIRQGRPTPVIAGLGSPEEVERFWAQYGRTETRTLQDGTQDTVTVIDFDPDQVLTLGGTATFGWVGPGSFVGDSSALLQLCFYLILQHTEVPEFVWGNAIASSMASATTQTEPFAKWVQKKQSEARKWYIRLAQIVMRLMSLSDPEIKVNDDVTPVFEPMLHRDQGITLSAVQFALASGLITKETALRLLPLPIEDVESEVAKAQEQQRLQMMSQLEVQQQAQMQQMAAAAQIGGSTPVEDEEEDLFDFEDEEESDAQKETDADEEENEENES